MTASLLCLTQSMQDSRLPCTPFGCIIRQLILEVGGSFVQNHSISLLFALLLLLLTPAWVWAQSEGEDTGYDICYQDFMASADARGKPRVLYTAKTTINLNMRSKPDLESESLGQLSERETVQIWGYDQDWLFCWDDAAGVYYIRRRNVDTIEPVSADIEPYGVIQNRFVAYTSVDTMLRTEPRADAEEMVPLPAGTRLSMWMIEDGWAVIPYKRVVGYVYVGDLTELTPVAPDPQEAKEDDILSAFTTFYSTKTTELNVGRMENLRVGCDYIARTYQPGEVFDFNAIAGPYRKNRGYMPSPVLIGGGTVAGYGGGTCQVSTTLYNAILQLPDGLTVLWRRPHGPGGAKYAPHGVDAAVGAENLNLEFRNDYDFPVYLDSTVLNGSLCICIRKGTL